MILADLDTGDLIAELKRRFDGVSIDAFRHGCVCSAAKRRTIENRGDETFYPRTGCLNCNNWDGPPVLRRP